MCNTHIHNSTSNPCAKGAILCDMFVPFVSPTPVQDMQSENGGFVDEIIFFVGLPLNEVIFPIFPSQPGYKAGLR